MYTIRGMSRDIAIKSHLYREKQKILLLFKFNFVFGIQNEIVLRHHILIHQNLDLMVCLCFDQILRHRKKRFHQIHSSLRNEDKNFLYVWFLLYALRVWGTVRFFLVTFDPAEDTKYMDVLLRLQALGDPAQAFVNCFLFCFLDETVFEKLKQIICCRTKSNQERRSLLSSSSSCDDAYGNNHGGTTSNEPLADTEHERRSSGYSSVASTRSESLQLRDSVNSSTNRPDRKLLTVTNEQTNSSI